MATGSGKTYAAITSSYRPLKNADAKRILFLADTKSLGERAGQEFMTYVPSDDNRKFTGLYNIQLLKSSFVAKDNRRRRHSSIGDRTPAQVTMDMTSAQAAWMKNALVRNSGATSIIQEMSVNVVLLNLCAISVSLVILISCTSAQQEIDRNVSLFDELAFGGALDNDVTQDTVLSKWASTIRVSLVGDNAGQFAPEVTRQFKKILKLTGLSFHLQEALTKETNYLIRFSTEEGHTVRKEFVPCSARLRVKFGVIEKVEINISTAKKSLISECIAHEMMHSFGFRYHSAISKSILSPVHGEQDFTRWDELMLATLYDDSLLPDSSRAETLASVRGLIESSRTK